MDETKNSLNIRNIPKNIKHWKSLAEYNKSWNFINYNKRYRIAENLAALDYFTSIYDWLSPRLVFADVHKRQILILVASIYECALEDSVVRTAKQELVESTILKKYAEDKVSNKIDKITFEQLINDGGEIGIYGGEWKEYLHKVRVVRDWIHLSKKRDENLESWFDKQLVESFKPKLEEFRNLVESYLSTIWAQ